MSITLENSFPLGRVDWRGGRPGRRPGPLLVAVKRCGTDSRSISQGVLAVINIPLSSLAIADESH